METLTCDQFHNWYPVFLAVWVLLEYLLGKASRDQKIKSGSAVELVYNLLKAILLKRKP